MAAVEKCGKCGEPVYQHESTGGKYKGAVWHKLCFKCNNCRSTLQVQAGSFTEGPDGMPYCKQCFDKLFHKKYGVDVNPGAPAPAQAPPAPAARPAAPAKAMFVPSPPKGAIHHPPAKFCGSCGHPREGGAKFCNGCGQKF